jgi:hypothetical protein
MFGIGLAYWPSCASGRFSAGIVWTGTTGSGRGRVKTLSAFSNQTKSGKNPKRDSNLRDFEVRILQN